jgi:hypothetical protein
MWIFLFLTIRWSALWSCFDELTDFGFGSFRMEYCFLGWIQVSLMRAGLIWFYYLAPSWTEKGARLQPLNWSKKQVFREEEVKKVPSWAGKGTELLHKKTSYLIRILLFTLKTYCIGATPRVDRIFQKEYIQTKLTSALAKGGLFKNDKARSASCQRSEIRDYWK